MELTDEQLNAFFINVLAKNDDKTLLGYVIFKLTNRITELEAELETAKAKEH